MDLRCRLEDVNRRWGFCIRDDFGRQRLKRVWARAGSKRSGAIEALCPLSQRIPDTARGTLNFCDTEAPPQMSEIIHVEVQGKTLGVIVSQTPALEQQERNPDTGFARVGHRSAIPLGSTMIIQLCPYTVAVSDLPVP